MNKNQVIGILAALLVLGSLWGQVGNRTKKSVVHEKKAIEAHLAQVESEAAAAHEALLLKTAQLEKSLKFAKSQIKKSRKELVGLRKDNQTMEAKLADRKVNFARLMKKKDTQIKQLKKQKASRPKVAKAKPARTGKQVAKMQAKIKSLEKQLAAGQAKPSGESKQIAALQAQIAAMEQQFSAAVNEAVMKQNQNNKQLQSRYQESTKELHAKLQSAAAVIQDLQNKLRDKSQTAESTAATVADNATKNVSEQNRVMFELESMSAQILGLEKIIEEKNTALEETSRELDHWKVNMDVLISRITEQKDGLQELQEENNGLVKELAAKNKELADVNEQLIKTPVQQ